jgi:hypothetical protein
MNKDMCKKCGQIVTPEDIDPYTSYLCYGTYEEDHKECMECKFRVMCKKYECFALNDLNLCKFKLERIMNEQEDL